MLLSFKQYSDAIRSLVARKAKKGNVKMLKDAIRSLVARKAKKGNVKVLKTLKNENRTLRAYFWQGKLSIGDPEQ